MFASHAICNRSVPVGLVWQNDAMGMSAIRPKIRMKIWFVKMMMRIVDRVVRIAIRLRTMQLRGHAILLMARVLLRNAKPDIMFIAMHVKRIQQVIATVRRAII